MGIIFGTLPTALHPGFSGPWRPPPALSSTLATFCYLTFCKGFSSQLYRKCYGFEPDTFYSQAFLPCILSLHGTFCDSDGGRITLTRIHLCPCPHKVVLSGWRMVLDYSYCRLNTIGLPIAPVSHEVWSP